MNMSVSPNEWEISSEGASCFNYVFLCKTVIVTEEMGKQLKTDNH